MKEIELDLPLFTSICDIQEVTARETHLQKLKAYIIKGLPHIKENVAPDIEKYWPTRHELAMKDGMAIKGTRVIIPSQLQVKILKQLHSNHMEIQNTR